MPTTIAIEARNVLGGIRHLYLVKTVTASDGEILEEEVIRGGPGSDLELEIQAGIPLALSEDARGLDTPEERRHTVLNLSGRDPEEVWNLMVQHAASIGIQELDYGELNSNTVVASALHTVGISPNRNLPAGIERSEVPGYTNVSDMEVHDVLLGGSHDDVVYSGAGHDLIRGFNSDDNLSGESGSDILYGGVGDDALQGGDGDDSIRGDRGHDLLTGGEGEDVFSYTALSHSGVAYAVRDIIFDFERGIDTIDLTDIDANTNQSGNQSFTWVAEFTGTAGELEWDPSPKGIRLSGDVDGDAVADFSIEVRINADRVYGSDIWF